MSSFPGGSERLNQHPSLTRTASDDSYGSNTYEEAMPVIPPRKNNNPCSAFESVSVDDPVLSKAPPPRAKFKPVIPEEKCLNSSWDARVGAEIGDIFAMETTCSAESCLKRSQSTTGIAES